MARPPAGPAAGRVEAALGVVQRGLHEGRERDGPAGADALDERPGSPPEGVGEGAQVAEAEDDLREDADHDRGHDGQPERQR